MKAQAGETVCKITQKLLHEHFSVIKYIAKVIIRHASGVFLLLLLFVI